MAVMEPRGRSRAYRDVRVGELLTLLASSIRRKRR